MNILVTGSSKGIGYELTLNLCKKANHVIAISRNNTKLNQLKTSCLDEAVPGRIYTLNYDITSANIEKELPDVVKSFVPHIDVIINNAGVLINKPYDKLTSSDFDVMFDVNVKAVFNVVKCLLPLMNSGAHIVNISSMGGFQGSQKFKGLSLYSAAKAALAVLTECMALEFAEKEIAANCLALGAVQTEMLEQAFPGYQAPLQAEEMAEYIADFALNGNKYFNGKIIPVSLSTP